MNDSAAPVSAVICAVIAYVLMSYQHRGVRHRPGISILAYLLVLIYASVPFQFIFGLYVQSHWLMVMANVMICTAVLRARGNVARLVDTLRH